MKRLSILGSTGSIGTQALETCEKNGWEITALAAGRNVELAETQARKFLSRNLSQCLIKTPQPSLK